MLLYAAETWTVNKEDEKDYFAFEMRCYRRILAVKWQDRRTNEEIRAVLYNEKNSGGYNPNENEEAPNGHLQDAR